MTRKAKKQPEPQDKYWFLTGDLVQLKSGGGEMVVLSERQACNEQFLVDVMYWCRTSDQPLNLAIPRECLKRSRLDDIPF